MALPCATKSVRSTKSPSPASNCSTGSSSAACWRPNGWSNTTSSPAPYSTYEVLYGRADKTFGEVLRESLFVEIKNDFNTELFEQPLLCDQLAMDNVVLSAVIGHEPLAPELAAQCGFESGQGELLAFRHLYRYDFSLMSSDVMGAVYERFLAHKLLQDGGRVVIEDTDELRKKEGIYYTPQYIVDYIVAHTLGEKIKPILAEAKTLLGYKNFKGAIAKIRELGEIKVLDPAMGSGSFLLRAFDALVGPTTITTRNAAASKRTATATARCLTPTSSLPRKCWKRRSTCSRKTSLAWTWTNRPWKWPSSTSGCATWP